MSDLLLAIDFVSSDGGGMNEAFLCRRTGKIFWRSPNLDEQVEELPDDLDENENYIAIPAERELNLGKSLVLDFAAEFMPDGYDKVRRIFGRRGAYGNFKMLLEERGQLKQWYDFEAQATERALRDWSERIRSRSPTRTRLRRFDMGCCFGPRSTPAMPAISAAASPPPPPLWFLVPLPRPNLTHDNVLYHA